MTKKTHIAVGVAATLPLINHIPLYALVGLIGATLPDIDLILHLKHRTLTHSLMALFSCTLIMLLFNEYIALVFFINYFTHLILDSFTKMGVPFLYPWNKKYFGLKLVRTGGAEDLFLLLITLYLTINYILNLKDFSFISFF